ncbi:Pseudouridine-metabolizing bifunctional protein [Aphelenchoides bicaudatus]|nr:Pseudouridine-metabolizing bifunctional protein [Aphelenchoides bicaudatus]
MKLNVALLKNNARIATRLASEMSKKTTSAFRSVPKQSTAENKHPKVLCVGGSIYDLEIVLPTEPKNDGGSYPSEMCQRAGGVGRNHAEAFTRLGCDTSLITVVGNDIPGKFLFPESSTVKKDHVYWVDNVATSTYVAINVGGNIRHGFSAIEPASKELTPSRVEAKGHLFEQSDYIFLEGNLQPQTLKKSVELANVYGKKIWYDPTDINKVWKIVETGSADKIAGFSPNANEFIEYCKCLGVSIPVESLINFNALADFINTNKSFLHRIFPDQMEFLIVTLGANGCLLLSRSNQMSTIEITTIDAPTKQEIVSASGSGDCFNSAFLTAHLHGANAESCMRAGQIAAGLSLQSLKTVPESINFKTVVEPFLLP